MTPADLERFRRLAGMLGSEHVGERAAAALKCTELLKAAGLTWSSVSLPVEQPDVLAQRREAMDTTMKQHTWRKERDADTSLREHLRAKRAAWRERSYGADADGFDPERK